MYEHISFQLFTSLVTPLNEGVASPHASSVSTECYHHWPQGAGLSGAGGQKSTSSLSFLPPI